VRSYSLLSFISAIASGSPIEAHGIILVFDKSDRRGFATFQESAHQIGEFAQRARIVTSLIGRTVREEKRTDITEVEGARFAAQARLGFYTEFGSPRSLSMLTLLKIPIDVALRTIAEMDSVPQDQCESDDSIKEFL
jgi:hypothetical protein